MTKAQKDAEAKRAELEAAGRTVGLEKQGASAKATSADVRAVLEEEEDTKAPIYTKATLTML